MKKLILSLFILLCLSSCSSDEPSSESTLPPDGENPPVEITELWGMTSGGGINSLGAILKTDANGDNASIVYSFSGTDGNMPIGGLCRANNGKLYGMTSKGGTHNQGVIFMFDPQSNSYTKIYDFNTVNGSSPCGNLMQASNGKLYGLTPYGGVAPQGIAYGGILFEIDIQNNTFQKLHDFVQNDGYNPKGSLIEASNGKLYGTTSNGGSSAFGGSIVEYDIPSGTLTNKIALNGETGDHPNGDLVKADNGKLYGVTPEGGGTFGGNFYQGALYEYDPLTNSFAKKVGFFGNSMRPQRGLAKGIDGKLYGVCYNSGSGVYGKIFSYEPSANSISQTGILANQGLSLGSLFQSSNGKFYGLTHRVINNNVSGTMYEFDPVAGSITVKHQYGTATCNGCDDLGVSGNLIGR